MVLKTLVATNSHTNVAISTRSVIETQISDGYHGSCLTDEKQVLTIRDLTTVLRSGRNEREKREAVSVTHSKLPGKMFILFPTADC